jgi:predicted nucleotidyltransferase
VELKSDGPLEKVLKIIITQIDPERIILFGSRARGDFEEDSDYDLLIVKEGGSRKMLKKVYDSFSGIGVPVDMIVVDSKKLKDRLDDPFMIYGQAFKEGTVIYAKA